MKEHKTINDLNTKIQKLRDSFDTSQLMLNLFQILCFKMVMEKTSQQFYASVKLVKDLEKPNGEQKQTKNIMF